MITSIYILIDPRNGLVRYVGKTSRDPKIRFKEHVYYEYSNTAKSYSKRWIKSLKKERLIPEMIIIDEVEEDWEFWEKHYISLYKSWGFNLTNKSIGGQGKPGNNIRKIYEVTKDGKILNESPSVKEMASLYNLTAPNLSKGARDQSRGKYATVGGRYFTYYPNIIPNSNPYKTGRVKKEKVVKKKNFTPIELENSIGVKFFVNLILN